MVSLWPRSIFSPTTFNSAIRQISTLPNIPTIRYLSCSFNLFLLCQEAYVAELDAKSGASLKLTVLNKSGRIWTMVAGGGASVIYRYELFGFRQCLEFVWCDSDTVCDLGGSKELANYGEYSGAPSESQTYDYAKTILSLMVQEEQHPQGMIKTSLE